MRHAGAFGLSANRDRFKGCVLGEWRIREGLPNRLEVTHPDFGITATWPIYLQGKGEKYR